MYHRRQGDRIGEIDEDGIAQWYPKCKVRKEGDFYIATPHTTNPTRRTKRKQKAISVSVKDGKYALETPDLSEVGKLSSKRKKARLRQKKRLKSSKKILLRLPIRRFSTSHMISIPI